MFQFVLDLLVFYWFCNFTFCHSARQVGFLLFQILSGYKTCFSPSILQTTNTGSENAEVEIPALSTADGEEQTEPQPEPWADLTTAAPPSYTTTASCTTLPDTGLVSHLASHNEPFVLLARVCGFPTQFTLSQVYKRVIVTFLINIILQGLKHE